jgi:hypothetical protein
MPCVFAQRIGLVKALSTLVPMELRAWEAVRLSLSGLLVKSRSPPVSLDAPLTFA